MMPLDPTKLIIPDLNEHLNPERILLPDLAAESSPLGVGEDALYGQPDTLGSHIKQVFSGAKRIPGNVLRGLSVEMKAQALSIRPDQDNEDAWYTRQLSIMTSVDKAKTLSLAGQAEDAGIGIDSRAAIRNAIDQVLDEKKRHAIEAAEAVEKASEIKAFQPLPGYERPTSFIGAVEQGLGQQAPRLMMMFLAPLAAVPEMYLEISGATYQHLTEQGVDPERARFASRLDAAAQTPLEFLGDLVTLKSILKPQAWKNLIRGIAKTSGTEGLEEFAQQYPDELATYWAMNPDATNQDIMDHLKSGQVLGEALFAAGVGAVTGGLMAGAGGMTHAGLEKYITQKQKGTIEERKQTLLDALGKARVGEKLNEGEQELLDKVVDSLPEDAIRRIQYQTPIISDARDEAHDGMLQIMGGDEARTEGIMTVLDSIAHSYADLLGVDPEQFYEKELKIGGKISFDDFQSEERLAAQYQGNDERNLAIVHNLSVDNLRHAIKMGGLPVPSTAVIDVEKSSFDRFGEITLIASKDRLGPEAGSSNKYFNADVYSPRYPEVTYKLTGKSLAKLNEMLAPYREEGESEIYTSTFGSLDELTTNKAFRKYALEKTGKKDFFDLSFHELQPLASKMLTEVGSEEKIFNGFTYQGNRRYLKHDLATVVRLLKKELKDGEGFNYGVPSIRAKNAVRFRTIKQIQANRDKIIPKEDMQGIKDEADREFLDLADAVIPFLKNKRGFGDVDSFSEHIKEAIESHNFTKVFGEKSEYYEPGVNVGAIIDFVNKLNTLPTEYFEGKIQRAVGVTEFDHAVVPSDTPQDILDWLSSRGIRTDVYKRGDIQDRKARVANAGRAGNLLFQIANKNPLGATVWTSTGSAIIYAFEGSNVSTPVHEIGHVLLGLIERYDPSSFKAIQAWLKIDENRAMQGSISWTTEEHERFAKGFEVYMMEGRAPSFRLVPVFKRMKNWLLEIYRRVKKLDVQLNDDVRRVFDQWLTTEDERAADAVQDASNWFNVDETPHPMGDLVPDDYQDYDDIAAKAAEIVAAKIGAKRKKQEAKTRAQLWGAAKKLVDDEPFWIDIADLKKAGGLSEALVQGMRNWGKDEMAVFREWGIISKKSTLSPDGFAHSRAMLGGRAYDRAEDFLDAVLDSPKKKAAIDAAYARSLEEYEHWKEQEGPSIGDMSEILDAEIAVLNALMGTTPASSRVMSREIGEVEHLTFEEVQNLKKQFKDLDRAAREAFGEGQKAEKTESEQKTADLKARQKERIGEIRAKNLEKVLKLKEQQRVVIAKLRERQKIQKEKAKIQRRMKRYLKSKSMTYEARFQLQRLLRGYFPVKGFVPDVSQPDLSTYLKNQMPIDEAQDFITGMIELLPAPWRGEDGRVATPGRRSLDDLQTVSALADIIHGLDRMKQEEIKAGKAEKRRILAEGIYKNHGLAPKEPKGISYRKGWMDKARQGKDTFLAELTKIEFLCNYLDKLELIGPMWQTVFKPLADAEGQKLVLLRQYMKELHAIMEPMSISRAWSRDLLTVEGYTEKLTREQMFLIALNSGNEGNRRDLVEGNQIPDEVIDRIFNEVLTDQERQAVTRIWDLLDSLFPMLDDVNKRLLGFPLKKVEGHYFPIVHDRELSLWAAKAEDQNAMPGDGMAPFYMAYPRAGHRDARTGAVRPLKLNDIEVVSRHIHQAVHDITHTIPVMDVYRTITDENVKRVIEDVAGPEMYKQLTPWLKNVSRPNAEPRSIMENIAKGLRKNTTVVYLGFKATTEVLQLSALTQSIEELGAKAVGDAVLLLASSPGKMVRDISEKSIMMRFRGKMYDREFNEFAQQISMGTIGKVTDNIGEMVLAPIAMLDLCAAYPTWLAAYNKAVTLYKDEEGQPDEDRCIDYADSVVRRTQSAAGPKDLAVIQQGNEFKKWAAMFYTFFSVYWNKVNESHKRAGLDGMTSPKAHLNLFRSFVYLTAIPAILSFLVVKGRFPEDDEWWKELISYRLGGLPVIRDIVSPALSGYDYEFSPAAGGLSAVADLVKDAEKARQKFLDGEEITLERLGKDALWAVGFIYGLPVSQMIISMDGMMDLWNDETDNPLRLLFRESRDYEE